MRHLIILTLACCAAFAAQAETISLRSDVKRAPVYPPAATTVPATPTAAATPVPQPAAPTPAAVAVPAIPVAPAPAVVTAPKIVTAPTNTGIAGLLPRVSPVPMSALSPPTPLAPPVGATPEPTVAAAPVADSADKDATPALVEVGYDPKVRRDPRGKAIIQDTTGAARKGLGPSA